MISHPATPVAVIAHMSERGEDVETGQDLTAHYALVTEKFGPLILPRPPAICDESRSGSIRLDAKHYLWIHGFDKNNLREVEMN
jgi:hypothetical protein